MDKRYDPGKYEGKIYALWGKGGYFTPKIDKKKKPFTILLPPPNASDALHLGQAMYTVEDVLVRWHRMLGEPTLWLPGTDHAGIETQFVFEKELAKKRKSRFDFDRNSLYREIEAYVNEQKGKIQKQLRRLGFSLDWTREKYTLDPDGVNLVCDTFERLHNKGLLYRSKRLVNYCTHCGTSFSNLEIKHKEEEDKLYYLDYGPVKIATVRPETIFADVAVAVNSKDKRYKNLIGKNATIPLINKEVPIIEDEAVQKDFGTGALKITPAHDPLDEEIGNRHSLPSPTTIGFDGKLNKLAGNYAGMGVLQARKAVVDDLKKEGKLLKTEPYTHAVGHCYRCGAIIEPLPLPQWFISTKPLAKPAIEAVRSGKISIVPKRFYKIYYQWMENILDWNISRQIVWGIRIPVWYSVKENPDMAVSFLTRAGKTESGRIGKLLKKYSFGEIEKGLQTLTAPEDAKYLISKTQPKGQYLQETDTFDTWFSSGQWPLTTLGYPDSADFKYFYPTSVLDTMWDILFFWVARMIMFGLYLTRGVPFRTVYLHSMVTDDKGQKMSKSRGNVINPLELVDKYGADSLRMSLLVGSAPGNPIMLSESKVMGYRNFANKVWNISRFVLMHSPEIKNKKSGSAKRTFPQIKNKDDRWIVKELETAVKRVSLSLEKYRLSDAGQEIYDFIWHKFADVYIEKAKPRIGKWKVESGKSDVDAEAAIHTLYYVLDTSLRLLHPFMPFVTETIWQVARTESRKQKTEFFQEEALIIAQWPVAKK